MPDPVDTLILDLLEWIGPGHRAYTEMMDAWRTSCPRLPVWEDANLGLSGASIALLCCSTARRRGDTCVPSGREPLPEIPGYEAQIGAR